MENHDGIRLHLQDFRNQTVLALGKSHVRPVIAFRLEAVRKPGEDHRFVHIFCRLYGLRRKRLVIYILVRRKPFGIGDVS